jgi:protoporphyrinogen oxidase
VLSILGLQRKQVTTLIEEFRYPRLGPGQMWEAVTERLEERGIPVMLNHRCVHVHRTDYRVDAVTVLRDGVEETFPVDSVLSSMPLSELVLTLDPPPPPDVIAAARRLRYRDFCLVALVIDEEEPFPDNWIYLHDPETRAGRVQNFGAWSPDMVQPGTTCLGVEYFCFEGDDIWELPEEEAIELASEELARIGLIKRSSVIGGAKVQVPKAYPMYDATYEEAVAVLREYVTRFENLRTFGRNGLHRYNNQDHSMWTAILATFNQLDGVDYDVWSVNAEEEYLEEGEAVNELLGLSLVPPPETTAVSTPETALGRAEPQASNAA